jgi:hypothetical protein
VRFPAGIIPLLDKLSFDVPDLRQCLDELWVHLSALHDPRHSTWASVSCAVWLVALAGIALEAARHWKANASGNRAFLAAPAWMPENYLPEETS